MPRTNKSKDTIKTRKKDDKTTPYTKVITGKVSKVRSNIKSSAKLTKQTNNSVKKNGQLASSKNNSSLIELHTHPSKLSSNDHRCNTLQEQCETKENELKNMSPSVDRSASNAKLIKLRKSKRRLEALHEINYNLKRKVDKTSGRQPKKPNHLSPVTSRRRVELQEDPVNEKDGENILKSKNTRKFDIRLKKIDKSETNPNSMSKKCKKEGRIESCKSNIGHRYEKFQDTSVICLNIKSCKEINLTRVTQGQQQNVSIPKATKRFVVKLQKTAVIKKTKDKLSEALVPSKIRNFVVKLKKIENKISKSITTPDGLKSNSQKHLINEIELTGITQIAELSLKRSSIRRNQNNTIVDDTICFEPVRNSTLLPPDKSKHWHNRSDETKIPTPTKDISSFRNLTNKSEIIEALLNTLDNEEEILLNSSQNKSENRCNEHIEKERNNSIIHNKSNKFFHRENVIPKDILKKGSTRKINSTNKEKVAKKGRFYKKLSTAAKPDQIYEFFSQSQTSDSDIAKQADPTADIIKKLIAQGRVRVATNFKGTGKPRFKRVRGQRKQIKENKAFKELKMKKKVKFAEENRIDTVTEDQIFEDHFEDAAEEFGDHDYDMEMERRDIVSNISNYHTDANHTIEQEGTFSRLARSVLINQAGRSDWQQKLPSALSTKDLNLVSTPKNKNMLSPRTALEIDLSPILTARPKPQGMTSPWRVNDDSHLPATFNFSRSSGNLPSFSSDFIPSTPRKEKRKIYLTIPHLTKSKDNDGLEYIHETSKLNDSPALSSFSSNDSNGENMPPKNTSEISNENDSLYNFERPANNHRTPNQRSPLKTLNIIEVLHLPPFQHMKKKTIEERNQCEMACGFDDNLKDANRRERSFGTARAEERNKLPKNTEKHSKDDLFGFEDYLSQTEYSSQESGETNNDARTNVQNQTIHDKLQDLRKLKLDEIEIEKYTKPIKTMPLFVDDDVSKMDGMRQRGIKEMLCSTMLHPQPSTSKEALRQLKNANLVPTLEDDFDDIGLFNDPEPETTFNEKEPHRTYVRPHRRKPRLRESDYLVYLDSDVSEDEDNSHENQKRQHSRESNSSSEHASKKKRNRKNPKENPELEQFMKEFNEICKDVDNYNLVIEKSK